MSHQCGHRRMQAEELSMLAVEDNEPTPGLTAGDLMNPPSPSVEPQQRPGVLALEHLNEPYMQAYGAHTAPSWVQLPIRVVRPSRTATQDLTPCRLAGDSGTALQGSNSLLRVVFASGIATQGHYSPRGIDHGSEGDTKEEHFTIPASEVSILRQEYTDFINLKDNAEIVLAEAMEATEQLNTVFSRIRTPMNRMSPWMRELLLVPSKKASGKTSAKAATEHIIDQMAMMMSTPGSGAEESGRTTRSHVPDDWHSRPPIAPNICENIPHSAHREQSDDSQLRCGRKVPTDIDMNTLREEIKEMISATIKEKLCSDADSVTTVSQSIQALDANAQYWSNLSNKATRCSRRALELQLKLAEEKVNALLQKEAPEDWFNA
ncbi:hypothetical protein M422DRAFT_274821 [Sphaerobolus stellatus SS14]|uniref:Uncharacterized protein n=1 Tax=Sphaerobolus stellatus (strain SS14) TaxID=990650 RepID=A0A0C9UGW5_SPHS4|nr:hypothetical protein M422DRAFT_274821 [Sphaerobolus stellatus SS14]